MDHTPAAVRCKVELIVGELERRRYIGAWTSTQRQHHLCGDYFGREPRLVSVDINLEFVAMCALALFDDVDNTASNQVMRKSRSEIGAEVVEKLRRWIRVVLAFKF